MQRVTFLFGIIVSLLAFSPRGTVAETPSERLAKLPANSWIAIEPELSKRRVLLTRNESSETKEITSREPAFREYTSPAWADGRIVYFGGGHSGYYGNDVEVYDPQANVWRQLYRPVCPPKDDTTYYSGGSERCYVDPETGAGQPYVLHGYARTGYDPGRKQFVSTAMFPTKVERDAAGKWKLVRQAFAYVAFDPKSARWELLAEVPDPLKPGLTSLSYDPVLGGMVAFNEREAFLFDAGKWTRLGGADVRLAASGGSGAVYLPQRKSHLIAVLGHGGQKEVGTLALFSSVEKRGIAADAPPEPLQRRIAAGTGGYNLILAYDSRHAKVVAMSVGEAKQPDVWTFDPANGQWTELPASPTAPKLVGVFEPGRGRAPLMYDAERNVFFLLYRDGELAKLWAYRLEEK